MARDRLPVAHLVHGFNVSDGGRASMGPVARPCLEAGWRPRYFAWGWSGLLTLRMKTRTAAEELAGRLAPGQLVVTHSHGWNVAVRASRLRPECPIQVIGYNPAARRDVDLPASVVRAVVLFAPDDWIVTAGGWWRRLATLNPRRWCKSHPWGELGRYGPREETERLRSAPLPKGAHHSGPQAFPEAPTVMRARRWILPAYAVTERAVQS